MMTCKHELSPLTLTLTTCITVIYSRVVPEDRSEHFRRSGVKSPNNMLGKLPVGCHGNRSRDLGCTGLNALRQEPQVKWEFPEAINGRTSIEGNDVKDGGVATFEVSKITARLAAAFFFVPLFFLGPRSSCTAGNDS